MATRGNPEFREQAQVAAEFLTRWGNLDDSGCYAMLDAPLQAFLSRGLLRQVFRQCSQPQQAKVEFPASSVQPNGSGDRDKYKLSAVTSFGSAPAMWKFEMTRLESSPFPSSGDQAPHVITRLWVGAPSASVSCPLNQESGTGARVDVTRTFASPLESDKPRDVAAFRLWRQGGEPGKGGTRTGMGEDDDTMTIRQKRIDEESQQKERALLNQDLRLTHNVGRKLKFIALSRMRVATILRRPRDVFCAWVFIVYWGVLLGAAMWGFSSGDTDRLVFGFDSHGNVCGSDTAAADLSDRDVLWWPDPTVKATHFCVSYCPDEQDVTTGTGFFDYLAAAEDGVDTAPILAGEQPLPAAYKRVATVATLAVTNRCLPVSGEFASDVGGVATLVADVIEAWPAILTAIFIAVVAGYLWLWAIVISPKCVVFGNIVLGLLVMLALIATLLARASVIDVPSTVPESLKSNLTNTGGETTLIIIALLLAIAFVVIIVLLWRTRKELYLADKIMGHGSAALRRARGILLLPAIKALLLFFLLVIWAVTSVHLASLGEIEQECTCPDDTLTNCVCARSFSFSVMARFFAFMHLVGLVWTLSFLLHLVKAIIASTVAEWYFQDRGQLGAPAAPTKPSTWKAYRRLMYSHFGTLALASAVALVAVVQRPILFGLIRVRLMFSNVRRGARDIRNCLGAFILSCCCYDTSSYLDVDAAIEQLAVHGGGFAQSARRGYKLRRRNKPRVSEITHVMKVVLMLSRAACVCVASLVAVFNVFALQDGNDNMGVGAPVLVIILVLLAAYTAAGLCIDLYAMAVDTILLCFFEDAERFGRSASMFMPSDLALVQDYIDANATQKGMAPSDAAAHARRLFGPKAAMADGGEIGEAAFKALGVRHVPTTVARLKHVSVWEAQPKPEEFKFRVQMPCPHESQEAPTVNVYVNKYPDPNRKLCFCIPDQGAFEKIAGKQQASAVGGGTTEAKMGAYHRQVDDQALVGTGTKDQWNGAGKIVPIALSVDDAGFMHYQTPAQQDSEELTRNSMAAQNKSRLRLEVQIESRRINRRLATAGTFSRKHKPAIRPTVDEFPRPTPHELGRMEVPFHTWLTTGPREHLGAAYVRVGSGHSQLSFAVKWFRYIHTHFYRYQEVQAQIPDVAHIIAGDVGDDHSMNFLFVMGLREVGIPARCLHGLLLQSCNNSTFDKTVEGQQRKMDALQQTRSELYIDGIGWIPADATPMRHAYQHHTQARRFAVMLGRAGEDLEIGDACLHKFGNDDGKLLLNSTGQPLFLQPGVRRMRRELVVEHVRVDTQLNPTGTVAFDEDKAAGAV